MIKGKN